MPDEQQDRISLPLTAPKCPHCGEELKNVGWLTHETGLVTFFHQDQGCHVALGFQLIPMERRRIALPEDLRPRGLG